MIKKIIVIMLSLFLLLPVVAYAQEGGNMIYRTNTVVPIDSNSAPTNTDANDSRFRMDNSLNNGHIPHVTIDDANSWIDRSDSSTNSQLISQLKNFIQERNVKLFVLIVGFGVVIVLLWKILNLFS